MDVSQASFASLEVGNLPSSKGELASDTAMRLDVGIYYQQVVSHPKWVVSEGMGEVAYGSGYVAPNAPCG